MRFVVALVACAIISGAAAFATSSEKAFRSDIWKQGQPDDLPVRARMVDDLLRWHAFEGDSRRDVVALLGAPDAADRWPEWDLSYWIGPYRGWSPEEAGWLLMRMDNGRVTEVRRVKPPYGDFAPLEHTNPSLEDLERSLERPQRP